MGDVHVELELENYADRIPAKRGYLDESTDPYLNTLVWLLQRYEPEQIILFGSRARGEADAYSDYDIVVIKRTERPFLERLQDMVPYLVEFSRPAEILVYTPEEFERMRETGLGWIVQKEGVLLYERPSD